MQHSCSFFFYRRHFQHLHIHLEIEAHVLSLEKSSGKEANLSSKEAHPSVLKRKKPMGFFFRLYGILLVSVVYLQISWILKMDVFSSFGSESL